MAHFTFYLYGLSGTGIVEKNHRTINFPCNISAFGIIDIGCNLEQFDGLTWLTLTPPHNLQQIYTTAITRSDLHRNLDASYWLIQWLILVTGLQCPDYSALVGAVCSLNVRVVTDSVLWHWLIGHLFVLRQCPSGWWIDDGNIACSVTSSYTNVSLRDYWVVQILQISIPRMGRNTGLVLWFYRCFFYVIVTEDASLLSFL